MKSTYLILSLFFLTIFNLKADDSAPYAEIIIENRNTSYDITVTVKPVGFIFNGQHFVDPFIRDYRYSPEAFEDFSQQINNFIMGGSKILKKVSGTFNYADNAFALGYDMGTCAGCDSLFGFSKYKIEIWEAPPPPGEGDATLYGYIWVDYSDWDLPDNGYGNRDLIIKFYSPTNITFHWAGSNGIQIAHPQINHELKVWKQIIGFDQNQEPIYGLNKNQNKGQFKSTNERNGAYLNWPVKSSNYPNLPQHIDPGSLFMKLSVVSGMTASLQSGNNMTVEYGGCLEVDYGATLNFQSNCTLFVKAGGAFCNKGTVTGTPHIVYLKGLAASGCCIDDGPFVNSEIILEDSAIVQLPDSSVFTLDSSSKLIMGSHSEFRMGTGAKILLRNGSRIFSESAKFTSIDSNETWDGIYLSDVAYDTLTNCVIENALNGINVEDKYSLFSGTPATEISNCEFSNKTSEQLMNMVYVNNSANVMIRNCSSSSLIGDGFAAGVIIEYCTAGGVNVIDNEIGYVTTGINVIQSSPYIARNTITGAGSSGTGIYLDNSNGTIEYNIVDNFEESTKLYYSSPYMLKNTLSDGNTACADVTAYSVPVMKPVASGTTLRWLGGNNYFTGQPGTAGITLESEGHPLMDSGYNVISVGNSLYMQGTISRVLYMRVNNWFDDPPENGKFDISGESIDYSEYFDGQSLPLTDYYELNEIGFGYYDTVYVDELEGDNMTAEDVFILAYKKEMERKFVEAVALYKNVITNYRTSNYAVSSVSRIFNCLEKSNAGINQYSAVKSYYDGIKNSNTYPQRIMEHAEDLAIKAKVRMGFIEEAISDYQTIINNNGNNPKGIHAQVNKLVLMNMNSGGDNMMIGNKQTTENYKANLLSLITGKNIQSANRFANNIPRHFKLYQNYPNPFNPKTSIKYEIPHHAQVTLTIYDLTGREILQLTEFKQAGSYSHTFDGTNYASGLYFYKIQAGSFVETKKMVLIK